MGRRKLLWRLQTRMAKPGFSAVDWEFSTVFSTGLGVDSGVMLDFSLFV